jgi:hypothetical protein
MSKVLKSLQLVTQSYNGTPDVGTGTLYASGSTMYFENATGTIFSLGSTTNGGYLIVREYTGSNPGGGTLSYTWNKPGNIRFIQVVCVGGGGGGGSGRYNATNAANITGGAGGGGGAIAWGFFDKSDLTQTSYTISVGAGGAGGAARTTPQSGFAGSAGQYTTFGGTLVSTSGGAGGAGGLSGNTNIIGGVGGAALNCLPGPGFAIGGVQGGQCGNIAVRQIPPVDMFTNTIPITTPANAGTTLPTPPQGAAGGGNGASNSSTPSNLPAATGSSGIVFGIVIPNNSTLSGSGANNLISSSILFQFTGSIPFTTTYGLGGGGNGGPISSSGVGIRGGDGGNYGAGGGGSSWAYTAPGSAIGGSGSAGLCVVLEYY